MQNCQNSVKTATKILIGGSGRWAQHVEHTSCRMSSFNCLDTYILKYELEPDESGDAYLDRAMS